MGHGLWRAWGILSYHGSMLVPLRGVDARMRSGLSGMSHAVRDGERGAWWSGCQPRGGEKCEDRVTGLSPTLRGYLWTIYAACATLALAQAPLLRGALAPGVFGGVVVFGGLAYLAERTTLQITQAVNQTVTGAVHIATILLFPPPLPLALTLLATLAAELPQTQRPLHKRAFNICLAGLSVGIPSLAVARLRGTGLTPLRPGHVTAALPALVGVILLYYALNSALLHGWRMPLLLSTVALSTRRCAA